ncbi:MAG: MarR family transcriptional regulator [Comamonadaceae bacterium]|nr:MarR family transcriptional regulator [Comamonadaceae bacterium]
MENPKIVNDYQWRTHNPGRILSNALRRFEDRVLVLMREAGYAETRRTHVNLTRHLDLDGTRITELAKRAAMTNAAMTELIDQCAALKLVARVLDPRDKRARIVCFTPKGLDWLRSFGHAVAIAETEMAHAVGEQLLERSIAAFAQYSAAGTGSR